MAYLTTDLILANHYNTFVAGAGTFGIFDHDTANLNTVWGAGFGDKGYGQTDVLTQVPVGTVVSATQWANLFARLNLAAIHQSTSQAAHPGNGVLVASNVLVVGIEYEIVTAGTGDWTTVGAGDSNPGTTFRATGTTNGQSDGTANQPTLVGGDLITAITTLQTNVTNVFDNRLDSIATASTQVEAAAGSSDWPASSIHTINVQFADFNAVRYFFNAGGNISLTFSRSGGAGTPKDDSWDDEAGAGILPESGTVILGEHNTTKSGGAGVDNTDFFVEDGGEVDASDSLFADQQYTITTAGTGDWTTVGAADNNPGTSFKATGTTNGQSDGTATRAGVGYYELGVVAIQVFQQFVIGGGVYSANNVAVQVSTNGTQGPAGDSGDLITFTVIMTDDAGDPPSVTGTTTATVTLNFPETTNISDTWGVGGPGAPTFIPASGVVQT